MVTIFWVTQKCIFTVSDYVSLDGKISWNLLKCLQIILRFFFFCFISCVSKQIGKERSSESKRVLVEKNETKKKTQNPQRKQKSNTQNLCSHERQKGDRRTQEEKKHVNSRKFSSSASITKFDWRECVFFSSSSLSSLLLVLLLQPFV